MKKRLRLLAGLSIVLVSIFSLMMCGKDDGDPNESNDTNNDVVRYDGDTEPSWEIPIVGIVEPDRALFQPDVELTGFARGPVSDVRYETDDGDGGELTLENGQFSLDLRLGPGDTTVTVTAVSEDDVEVSDSVRLTYYPDTALKLELSERGIFVGDGSTVEAHVQVLGLADSVELVAVDEAGAVTETLTALTDDGAAPDEDAGDFLFAGSFVPDDGAVAELTVRAAAEVAGETVFSPTRTLHILQRPSQAQLKTMLALPEQAADWYNAALETGTEEEAAAATVTQLREHPGVTDAELTPGGDTITWRLDSGVQEVLILRDELGGWEGDPWAEREQALSPSRPQALTDGPRIGSHDALLLAPFHTLMENSCPECRSEIDELKTQLEETFCPQITVDPRKDHEAGVAAFGDIGGQGIVLLAGHGGPTVLQADDPLNRWGRRILVPSILVGEIANRASRDQYMVELMLKALTIAGIVRGGPPFLAITPIFVDHFVGRLPDSIVVLSACRTLLNGTMAGAFMRKGAKAVVGYEKRTIIPYAATFNESFFERLSRHSETVDEAFRYAVTDAGGLEYGLSVVGDSSVKVADRCNGWTRAIEAVKLPGGVKTVYASFESTDLVQPGPHGYDALETRARCGVNDQSVTEFGGKTLRGSIVGSGSITKIYDEPRRKITMHDDGRVSLIPDPLDESWVTYFNWLSGTAPYIEEGSCTMSTHGATEFSGDQMTITDSEVRGSKRDDFGGGNFLQIDFRYKR